MPAAHTSFAATAVRDVPPLEVAMVQLAPFQCIMPLSPMAQASVADRESTSRRIPALALDGGDMLHAEPFQCRMPLSPTAQASLGPVPATPCRTPTLGLGTMLQPVPFQWLMKEVFVPE